MEVVGVVGVDTLEVRDMFVEPFHIPILGTVPLSAVHPAGIIGVIFNIRVVIPFVGVSIDV
jgi:hypothetical protein